jgi:hypothetical protein
MLSDPFHATKIYVFNLGGFFNLAWFPRNWLIPVFAGYDAYGVC